MKTGTAITFDFQHSCGALLSDLQCVFCLVLHRSVLDR